jgi:hypothetical protein
MSVHKKLQEARVKLQKTPLHKSGKNTFSGYSYFELGDFLPTVQEIFYEIGLCGTVSFGIETAELVVYDIDSGNFTTFTSPMSTAALKGCHEVQNLGAVQSYIRRYLWTTALEIVENDVLDAVTGKEPPAKKEATKLVTNQTAPATWAQPVAIAPNVATAPLPTQSEPAPSVTPVTDVPKKIEGAGGDWSITVTKDANADKQGWMDAVNEGVLSLLSFAESEADVLAIFKKNKVLFDTYKQLDEPLFKELMVEFTKVKEKYAPKVEA